MFAHVFEERHLERKVERFSMLGFTQMVRRTTPHSVVAAMEHGDVGEERLVFRVFLWEQFMDGDHPGLGSFTVELRDVRKMVVVFLEFLLVTVACDHR